MPSSAASKVPLLKHYVPLLKLVKSLTKMQQKVLMNYLDENAQKALGSIISAVVQSVNLPPRKKKLLLQQAGSKKKVLRALSGQKNLTRAQRTKLLEQTGGFPFTALLSIAIPLITEAIKAATK